MFTRTRVQLTVRNAAVLSVILISLNVSVYLFMEQMLFAQVDNSLMWTANNGDNLIAPAQKVSVLRLNQSDRPILQLFWKETGEPFPTPGTQEFTQEQLRLLRPSNFGDAPQTVQIGDQHFRVLLLKRPNVVIIVGNTQRYAPEAMQLFANVSAEIGMLRNLLYILLFGGGFGLIIAGVAGHYLAERALIPIRQSWEQQQQFMSDASHELRTPLSVIQAHSELMLRHPDHTIEQDSKHISTVLSEARRMSKLVNGMLTLARSDSDRIELEMKPVRFDIVVQECANKMRMLAEVKNIILHTEIDSQVEMRADEERIHQLLTILIDNAIKYTPHGGLVRVVARKLAHSVQLEVEDSGIGIDPDDLPRIFDRFYRSDKARTRKEGGAGLGLAIAKWIVERHKGKIRAESKPGAGTRMIVMLPAGNG
ncbi:sensor histidine kinase [Paenibacillus alkalitolerans]|uniref:sensor histidine kinase n=1 Tax=Paenibacillus alkalitolerans TaxID=2799335 RepID=UPI0018F75769|nr:ATP-binding protein [Paenibacillus alkalitolerans]